MDTFYMLLVGFILSFFLMSYMWVFYLAIMNLKRNRKSLTPLAKVVAYPMVALGLISDVLFNFTFGTLFFLELPKELLMTTRLQRHLNDNKNDWRDRNAQWFCHNFLNPFDSSGNHC